MRVYACIVNEITRFLFVLWFLVFGGRYQRFFSYLLITFNGNVPSNKLCEKKGVRDGEKGGWGKICRNGYLANSDRNTQRDKDRENEKYHRNEKKPEYIDKANYSVAQWYLHKSATYVYLSHYYHSYTFLHALSENQSRETKTKMNKINMFSSSTQVKMWKISSNEKKTYWIERAQVLWLIFYER